MMKLTENLFRIDPKAEYSDYYERAMYNHILSTQHPEHGGYVYFTSARPRHYRVYSDVNQGMWCCVGSGMENHVKYNHFIYTHEGRKLYVNLFVASELEWKEKGVTLRQETDFPYDDSIVIKITEGKKRFPLMLRYPGWVEDGKMTVTVNGKRKRIKASPSSYFALRRKWKAGDEIRITTPMSTRIEHMPGVEEYVAFMHGPVLLGMKSPEGGLSGLIADDGRWAHIASGEYLPIAQAPALVKENIEDLGCMLEPIEGKPLHFRFSDSLQVENNIGGELEPFAGIHDSRYIIYWLADTPEGYASRMETLAQYEKERLELERRSLDAVAPGEQQPEADHKMSLDRSGSGVNRDVFYRNASNGGYFSYELATNGYDADASLYLRLRGGEEAYSFSVFMVDSDPKELVRIDKSYFEGKTGFFGVEVPVPYDLIRGKKYITIRIQADADGRTANVYGVRLLKK